MKLSHLLVAPIIVGLSSTAFVGLSGVQAQTSVGDVMRYCAAVANAETASGQCVAATNGFLTSQPEDGLDDTVADLVDQLVQLAQDDPACTSVDDEIAQAIRIAARFASGPAALRIRNMAADVDCKTAGTSTGGSSLSTLGPANVAPTVVSPVI